MELLGKIITNILTALYEPFGFSLLLSFLAMFFYLYAYEPGEAGKGWKCALVTWYERFKGSVFFRKLFLLAFVTSMILFRTLLNRNLWLNPLSNVLDGWGIWKTVNGEQALTTEGICLVHAVFQHLFEAVLYCCDILMVGHTVPGIIGFQNLHRHLAVQLYTSLSPRRVRDFHPLERAHGAQTKNTLPAFTSRVD